MQTITLEDGTTQEVYSAEELQAQTIEAIEKYKTENPDKTADMEKLQADLTKANEDLKKFQDKDLNFANLRAAKDEAEKKAIELAKSIDDKINSVKKEVLEGVMQDHYAETVKSMAGGDEELKKKIEFHYKRIADPAATKEAVTKKLTDAWVLATKVEDAGISSQAFSSAGVNKLNIKSQPFTPEEKALAQKLAQAGGLGTLKDEDFK